MQYRVSLIAGIVALAIACSQNDNSARQQDGSPLSPTSVTPPASVPAGTTAAKPSSTGLPDRFVNMMDACDPTTFNAAVGEGTCVRNGGVTFADFLAQLEKHQFIGAWHFAPPNMTARVGQTLVAVNHGGEVHTFTEVEEFGGGIVPPLNALAGVPTMAPECGALGPNDFVAPGATFREEDPLDHAGNEKYQCCIHPWMRLELKVQAK
jgi:plastocyanin